MINANNANAANEAIQSLADAISQMAQRPVVTANDSSNTTASGNTDSLGYWQWHPESGPGLKKGAGAKPNGKTTLVVGQLMVGQLMAVVWRSLVAELMVKVLQCQWQTLALLLALDLVLMLAARPVVKAIGLLLQIAQSV